jgi:hypothetical protein
MSEVRLRRRQHEADSLGALSTQSSTGWVDYKAKFLRGFKHPFAGGFANIRAIVERF